MRFTLRPNALSIALATVGFTSTVGQLVLLRELIAVFYGNELVLGLILALWLAWVAVGAWGLARRSKRMGSGAVAAGLAAAAVLLPAQVALIRGGRTLLGVTPGRLVAFGPMVLTILLALGPLCLLLGWQFTLGARLLTQRGESPAAPLGTGVGAAYVAESAGALLGGALFSFLLVRWLDPFQTALVVGALNLAVVASLAGRRRWLPALGAVALAAGFLPLGGWLHRTTLGWQYAGLRFARDSIYGRIAVTGSGEQRVFYENGLLFFETQGVAAEEVAHLPLLAHPEPRRVLLIGGGVSGTLAETLRHPSVEAAHYVELDPLVVAAARAELPPPQAAALDDPRVTLAHVDGRVYVRQRRRDRPFDVIVLDLPEPATGQLNRFYTQEFFAEVRAILGPGGVFALGLPWQENYPGPALQRLGASVYRTLASEFPHIALLPGERLFMLASDAPLTPDPETWSARLADRGIEARWVVPSYLDYLLTTDRVAQARDLLEAPIGARLNRDLAPISYFYDLTVWLSRFYSGLSQFAARVSPLSVGWLAVPLAVAALLLRRWAVPAAIGLIGLAEMTLEVAVLFAFQVVHGYVYGQVGLIVTAFMAGLALGGSVANRWRWPAGQGGVVRLRLTNALPHRSPRAALAWIQVGVVLFALGFPPVVALRPPAWVFPLLALMAGGLTGLAFPTAVACVEGEAGRVAGLLYGADLVGGCLGAALASALLVPILGIPHTCLAVALVGLAGLVALL
jgi:spermidine synthase